MGPSLDGGGAAACGRPHGADWGDPVGWRLHGIAWGEEEVPVTRLVGVV